MAKYNRFEELPVWKAAIDLGQRVFALVEDRGFNGMGDLRDQLQRSSLSISNNIAEGFERGTTADLIWFLYISRGSAGEPRSALHFTSGLPRLAHLKSEISNLISRAESISRQLRGWLDSLQNTDIPGQRHLNDQSLLEYHQRRRSDEFMKKLREMTQRYNAPMPPMDSDI